MRRGFVYDVVTLFVVVFLFLIAFSFSNFMVYKAQDILQDQIARGNPSIMNVTEFEEEVVATHQALDFVVPLLVGLGCVAMLISAYSSQSTATMVVLFVLIGMIGMVAIVYLNSAMTDFFGYLQLKEARLSMPYTLWTIQNLPAILGLTLLLMALFMHSKTQTIPYR
jgi:hypothetical protein